MNQLQAITSKSIINQSPPGIQDLLDSFFQNRAEETLKAYEKDLRFFAEWVGDTIASAARMLITAGQGKANLIVLQYRNYMLDRLAPNTINRRLAAINSLVKQANLIGLISWELQIEGVKAENYKDTSGPGLINIKLILNKILERGDKKGLRDYAIARLLFDLGLRRGEISRLNKIDFNSDDKSLNVIGKGKRESIALTLPEKTFQAISEYLNCIDTNPGDPLFINFDRAGKGKRLTGSGIFAILKAYAKKAGVKRFNPHGWRHTAITTVLDTTKDYRITRAFSRHRKVETIQLYDDNKCDFGGNAAKQISELI